ncbi:hypothetical protein [Micromonospora sp. DT227]|uniref:hypothetical protein n=1 Tax=Micromonospora sp. DT227 TaxID=3393433 RepID=UPI003CF493E5
MPDKNLHVVYADTPEILPPGTDYGMDVLGEIEYGAKLGDTVIIGEPDELRSTSRSLIEQMEKLAPANPVDVTGPAQQMSAEQGWSFEALTNLAYDFLLDHADNTTRAAFLAYLRDAADNENVEDQAPADDESTES